jgi:hypothetical protein
LLTDEVYAAGLRDELGEFRPRALFILDEAHHAAPAAGIRYATSSQLTKAVRELGERFEHRLFLTATPHNGHSNSFSALLEMLDPQRFERGIDVHPKDLEPVMVRRRLGEAFPERIIEAVRIADLPEDTPELNETPLFDGRPHSSLHHICLNFRMYRFLCSPGWLRFGVHIPRPPRASPIILAPV